jgi:hypothetical protein
MSLIYMEAIVKGKKNKLDVDFVAWYYIFSHDYASGTTLFDILDVIYLLR